MGKAGIAAALTHHAASAAVQPGITTQELDRTIENMILENGVTPSFKSLYDFPAAICISVDSVVVYGIPGDTVLCDGDIISVGIGARYQGYHRDSAWVYGVGKLNEEDRRLMCVSKESLYEGLKMARAGNHLTDIPHATGEYVFTHGYLTPGDYTGHGIRTSVYGDPTVPNFGPAGRSILLQEGMTLAVEPMIHAGKSRTGMLKNGWGVVIRDDSKTAHFEHTIVITNRGHEILTTLNKKERPSSG